MESMELGINRRIALEVDVRCNVCETLARIPRYSNPGRTTDFQGLYWSTD
jgi:hypothetical protein